MNRVIVIVGPTASGKTALSIELAKKINGEIVSCDSMQIYRDMNIGSAKPTPEEMQGIKHYMIDVVNPNERFSVAEYKEKAEDAIEEILKKGKIPIVVGGTGLYADSLIKGIEYTKTDFDEAYRKELERQAETVQGLKNLYDRAKEIDEQAIKKININDKKRILRVLEMYHQTGKTKTELEIESRKNGVKYDYKVFALNMDRQLLYDRINRRVDIMLKDGLIQEVKALIENYKQFPTAMQGLGYKEVVQFFNGELTEDEMVEKIKQETRRYAKRQLGWFRRYNEIIWLDGNEAINKNINRILEEIKLKKSNIER